MAGRARVAPKKELDSGPPSAVELAAVQREIHEAREEAKVLRREVRQTAARLYGQGFQRKQVARILLRHLAPATHFPDGTKRPMEQRLSAARARLRSWEQTPAFRELVWQNGLIELDLQAPKIMKGVAAKARAGRVDAARLVFELTDRHNPKQEAQPAQVILAINGIPRPMRQISEEIEAEAEEVDD